MRDEDRMPLQEEGMRGEEALPERYSGSGENRSPTRIMKIEEIVHWDMSFGVTVGPAGYDHRLRCPYCGKRLLLLSHEGGRERTGIRIAYGCESCGAHSVVSFSPPGQRLELPEVAFGERIIVEKPAPIPPDSIDAAPERPAKRERQNSQRPAGGNSAAQGGGSQSEANAAAQRAQQQQQQRRNQPRQQNSGERGDTRSQQQQQQQPHQQQQQQQQRPQRNNNPRQQNNNVARDSAAPGSGTAAPAQRQTERQPRPAAPATGGNARTSDIQVISEVLQEQADKASSKAPPYQKRRRRPFRPPGSGDAGGNGE